ncbi:3-dehydroquinate synthase II [Paraburkholderia aspalathi]|uniref:3-dehydroquinate synthase II n=1 Tax=Paraburkholderia aspalathi TaxID=1324617 RepID=UPI0038B6DF11
MDVLTAIVPKISGAATVHDAGETNWWFDARYNDGRELLEEAERSNCTHIVIGVSQLDSVKTEKHRVVWVENAGHVADLPADVWVLAASESVREAAVARHLRAGVFLGISDLDREFPRCVEVCERGDDFVVIDIEHATYIPYELLLAKVEGRATTILRSVPIKGLQSVVGHVDQSLNAFATMEQGVGVLFRPEEPESIRALSRNLRGRQSSVLDLVHAEVVQVQHTGLGSRVCVDTTTLMTADEGIVVGSTGWGGILVSSETHLLPHMNLREFRVNAGAVHSYVWSKDGKAIYLSELEAGSEVLCVNRAGSARVVTVGRAKIERRPMLKIVCRISVERLPRQIREAAARDAELKRAVTPDGEGIAGADERYVYINTFLQNDWHVRVMGAEGKVRHCTLLQPGTFVLAHVDFPGRHTGIRVTEHIIEK